MGNRLRANQAKAEALEFKSNEHYQLAYSWGTLHVTHRAQEAYGLEPLNTRPETLQQAIPLGEAANRIRTNIWLIGPDELWGHPPDGQDGEGDMSLYTGSNSYPVEDGIEIVVGFDGTHQKLVQDLASDIEAGIVEMVEDERPDALDQQAHVQMVHSFIGAVAENIPGTVIKYLQESSNSYALTKARKSFLIWLGLAAANPTVNYALEGEVHPLSIASSGVFVTFGAAKAYRGLKAYVESTNERLSGAGFFSLAYTSTIANDLHSSFCPNYFDHQFEQMLDQTPDAPDSLD